MRQSQSGKTKKEDKPKFECATRNREFSHRLLLLVGFIVTAAHSGLAQNGLQNPLNFGNNFFVTGDYLVAGAYGMNYKFQTINGNSYTVGTIYVPDSNPGITGARQVPNGAQVVSALLYWQTVEKAGTTPGGPGSGQNAYFRPLLYQYYGGPAAPGYAVSGTNVAGGGAGIAWSSSGCSGASTGKVLQTYRADVTGGLPIDGSGNSLANGSFEVRLASAGYSSTPFTLGATLVIIYRIPTGAGGPNIPLNSIVIYDGDAAPSNGQQTVTQTLQGFYDADHNPASRLTFIVGNGDGDEYRNVYLNGKGLPSLYGYFPAFPAYYGEWDNPTWSYPNQASGNPVLEDSASATAQVAPYGREQDECLTWAAAIVSTTVKNPDKDGILYSWKTNQGYCDVAVNPNPSCGLGDPAWVDLTGSRNGQQDLFLQYDYMCSSVTGAGTCSVSTQRDPLSAAGGASGGNTTYTGTFSQTIPAGIVVGITGFTKPSNNGQFTVVSSNSTQLVVSNPSGVAEIPQNPVGLATYADPTNSNYSFDPRLSLDTEDGKIPHDSAVDKVVEAYARHGITLHAIPGNAIKEDGPNNPISCAYTDPTCTFPNEPGTIGFREGLAYIKNSNILTSTGVIGSCTVGTDPGCVPVFEHGKKDSYHYALFSHGVGLPNWFLADGSLASVKQSGHTVTFTTQSPHGISQVPGDTSCPLGRVTVVFAVTNSNLEGTFCVLSNPAPTANAFSITVGGNPTNFTYTATSDPNLSVANGQVTSMSGFSDVGGQNSVISLGYGGWGPPNNPFSEGNKWQVKAGTFMHELGHTMALTHGGTFYNKLAKNRADYTPSFEVNCKPNVQSSMSYLFQFDLLPTNQLYANNQPVKVVDYSEDPPPLNPSVVPTLVESKPAGPGILNNLTYPNTSWFQLTSFNGATPATSHCDGSPIGTKEKSYAYVSDSVNNFFWSATNPPGITGNDIDFNGSTTDVMDPHNEWQGTPAQNGVGPSPGIDLLQISAVGTVSTTGVGGEAGGLKPQGGGGGLKPAGGGGGLKPAGGGGGLKPAGGGGGLKPAGGGGLKAEITHGQAAGYAHPPQGLFITQEESSPRLVDLAWFSPTIGAVVQYNISRSVAGGAFAPLATVPGNQTSYTDTVTCNTGGYSYRVTSVTLNDQGQQLQSSPSNTVPAFGQPPVTGCYASPVTVAVQTNAVQGAVVPITWTLTDDYYIAPGTGWQNAAPGNPVTNLAASTLVANGPLPNNCPANGSTTVLQKGVVQKTYPQDASVFSVTNPQAGQFTLSLDTDGLCAGTYTFKLTLDSGQTFTSSALQLAIDVNDQDNPRVTTLTLPPSTVGLAYNDTLTEDGGTAPFTWTVSGLPVGISQQAPGSPTLSGMTCVAAGSYNSVMATVTDAKSNSGTQGFTLQVNKATTTTTVASNVNPSVFQQPVTFTVTVAPQYSCTPTGTVTLYDGQNAIGSASLANGMATFSLSNLSVAIHSITASYGGDASFTSSTSVVLSQTVNKAPTTTTVLSSLNPSVYQQMVTFTVTVAPQFGGTPTGTVTLLDGTSPIGSASLTNGTATVSLSTLSAGSHPITASYAGDPNFLSSTSGALSQTVNQATTTTTVLSSPNPSVYQQMVTFTVSVAGQYGGTPTGTVILNDGAIPIGSAPLTNGTATVSLSTLSAGSHSITASYVGDTNFKPSTSGALSQVVNQAQTQITFNSVLPSTVFVGQPVTVSYTFSVVAPGVGSPNGPTGNIIVIATDSSNNTSTCMTAAVFGGGMCTLAPAPTQAGNVTFTITYSGDGNFVGNGANGNYTVYQLVFTTQPSNTGVGNTITPAVVVTAKDSSNNPLTTFTGGITVAIGSGPGTLSGTTTQSAVSGVATFGDLSINKIANGYTLTASPAGGVPSATSAAFNIDTFYVDSNGNFGTLDLSTGTVTQIGAAGTVSGSNGIDLTPGLNVYAYNALNQLWQITPSSGVASQIGSGTTGSIPDQATTGALTDTVGSYFAIGSVSGILYSINLSDGTTSPSPVGATGAGLITGVPAGCSLESSLSGSATTLYYTVGYGGATCGSPLQDTLYVIDPTGQTPTSTVAITVSGSGVNGFVGSALVGGTLYGFTSGGQEYTIDTATGVATFGVATFLKNTTPTTAIFGAGSSQ